MIEPEKLNSALYALHLVLVELRTMSFSGADPQVMAELLDWAEAMPYLIAQPDEDRTHSFRGHLQAIAQAWPSLRPALVAFDENYEFCGERAAS
jgi:hypothetical protein